ncbi:glycosyltransferase family 4 protein [Phocaeicola dorei]|uniref:glycosyltransferase family 4 protein n=1 Tax=Phocaeicola dorei TaxID=357276 RepID=UPI001BDE6D01|nr:glycosyltransferase family 4 protein [Phocaeicola dorei]MBT1309930.1 glycosyltransferase family 4 protein [Phocaeicola dorei]MBT1314601.1 glycosyltransferase family 4 protein [Phocaeicola dorei]
MKQIVILYPAVRDVPNGGLKVVYDYANRLSEDNVKVNIVYASYYPDIDKSLSLKVKSAIKYLYQKCFRQFKNCSWYNLNKRISEMYVWEYTTENVPEADIYIATAVTTAKYANKLIDHYKGKGFYFIQDYESFICDDRPYVISTYRLPLKKIVISKWLKKFVEEMSAQDCELVTNGFDSQQYHLTIPIYDKNKYMVSMLYHTREAKDMPTGFEALKIVKQHIPELTVNMFGVYDCPKEIPEWIHYTKNPTPEQHLKINNESAIYLGCSKLEGWGLTVGEAMMCGQAVVCTDNKGYLEMAMDGYNALVSPVGDAQALADNIIKLIGRNDLRYRIAENGMELIKQFDIKKSYQKFKEIIEL